MSTHTADMVDSHNICNGVVLTCSWVSCLYQTRLLEEIIPDKCCILSPSDGVDMQHLEVYSCEASHAGKEARAEGDCQGMLLSLSHTSRLEPAEFSSECLACTNGRLLQIGIWQGSGVTCLPHSDPGTVQAVHCSPPCCSQSATVPDAHGNPGTPATRFAVARLNSSPSSCMGSTHGVHD